MADPSIDVERLVREVMARLGQAEGRARKQGEAEDSPARSPRAAEEPPPLQAASCARNGEVVVSSQVVTMAEVADRLEGVKRIVVSPQAVLTPSVRDELRRKNIALAYDGHVAALPAARVGASTRPTGGLRLVMVVVDSGFDPGPLARALQHEGIDVQPQRADGLPGATDQLAGQVAKPNTLALVISTHPAAALCLANRRRGVRAIRGINAATIVTDAASVGANVLVVDPRTTSFFQTKQMASRFCGEGVRECPEPLRRHLG
jgi:hypothetical protein